MTTPVDPNQDAENSSSGSDQRHNIKIDNLHLQANDLDSLRRLSETNPELAKSVVDNRDRQNRRETFSFAMGIIVTGAVAVSLIATIGFSIVNLGWWQSVLFVGAILGCSHLLQVMLKGEWSDTSWFGRLIDFGNKRKDKDKDDDD